MKKQINNCSLWAKLSRVLPISILLMGLALFLVPAGSLHAAKGNQFFCNGKGMNFTYVNRKDGRFTFYFKFKPSKKKYRKLRPGYCSMKRKGRRVLPFAIGKTGTLRYDSRSIHKITILKRGKAKTIIHGDPGTNRLLQKIIQGKKFSLRARKGTIGNTTWFISKWPR